MKQESRWSEAQLAIVKGAFAENELAINAIRKVLLENDLSDTEETVLQTTVRENKAVQEVLRRHYCPTLVVDAPIGQVQDRLTGVPVEQLDPMMATLHAEATEKAEACMAAHIDELFTGKPGMSFKSLYVNDREKPEDTFVGLMARNKYIVDAERLTHHLSLLAGRKEESPEETMKRLRKDSAK